MKRTLWLFVFLLALCAGLVWWQGKASVSGHLSTPQATMFAVLRPGQKILLGLGNWLGDVGRVMIRHGDILSENEKLQGDVANLEGQTRRLQRYRRENDELRQLINMKKPAGGKAVAAEIVSFDVSDYAHRVFINVAAKQGVQAKDVVYTAHGVVGQVIDASSSLFPVPTSEVLLLTDRRSGVGATVARTGALGVVQGTGGDLCKMDYLDYHADVRAGDTVLSSGLVVKDGGVFPKGLVLGRIIKIERDKTVSRLSAYIDPAVPFDQISALWVRTK